MSNLKRFEELMANMAALRKEANETGKQALLEGAKEIFEAFPEMESFNWHTYAPYFCDGDPCVYGVHSDTDSISINDVRGWDEDGDEDAPKLPDAAYEAVSELLGKFDDDTMKSVFTEDGEVTIYRDGRIETGGYDHD